MLVKVACLPTLGLLEHSYHRHIVDLELNNGMLTYSEEIQLLT